MRRQPLLTLGTFLLAGCAAAAGPVYEYGPTEAPLRYALEAQGALLIDTPMGEQRSGDSTTATIVFEIGGPAAEGVEVSMSFEALDIWAGGDFNRQHIEGGELLGQRFAGTLSQDGAITVSEAPETPASIRAVADPADIFDGMLPPLPPGGDESAESWAHSRVDTSQTQMSVETTYEGTARFAGDTTWNGQTARIIVSEGTATSTGRGTPAGAPGEIEFSFSGVSLTRYIWDPERGVMLASASSLTAEGELEVLGMQMKMPITYEGASEVRLQR